MLSPQLSAALQDTLAAGLYHCKHTYADLPFIQVCSDPTPVHCITVQGKMHSPLLSAALQDRPAAGLYHCNYTYADLPFLQVCSDPALMHCSSVQGKLLFPQACITANTPMQISSSYRFAATQHQCTATLFRPKCSPHCSVLLCKTGLQQAVYHCSNTYEGFLFIQVCSDPVQMQCSSAQGKT